MPTLRGRWPAIWLRLMLAALTATTGAPVQAQTLGSQAIAPWGWLAEPSNAPLPAARPMLQARPSVSLPPRVTPLWMEWQPVARVEPSRPVPTARAWPFGDRWSWLAVLGVLAGAELRRQWRRGQRQRQALQEATQQAQWHARRLAILSHELRTPLTGMLGMAELLAGATTDRRQRRYISTIRQGGELLLQLIDQGLDADLSQRGDSDLRAQPFAPEPLCRRVVELMQPVAQAKQLSLRLELFNPLPAMLQGDALRIEQVLFNTVGNAIKFTRQGAVCLASAWLENGWWLWIRDSGPGIPVPERERVFGRFQRLAATASSAGLGLGLAISREWVERMGGQISLHSADESSLADPLRELGQADEIGLGGTLVRISLPLSIAPRSATLPQRG